DPDGESPSGSPTDEDDGDDDEEPEQPEEPLTPQQEIALAWLTDLEPLLRTQQLLTLPYGDLDVAAAADHAPELIELAGTQVSAVLQRWGLTGTPVVGSPSGYLDLGAIEATDPEATVLMTDRAFGTDPPAVADLDGRK